MAEAAILGVIGIIAKKAGEKAAEIAFNQIIKEGSRLSHVRDDLRWIENQMGFIQSYLAAAEAEQSRTELVSNFIRLIWDLAYDVEDIINTYFPKMRSSRSWWKRHLDIRTMRIARGFVKEVEVIKRRVEDIKNARLAFGINESHRRYENDQRDPRQAFPHDDEPNVVGFDNRIKTLVHEVIDEDLPHRVVSIIGFAGLGKTTLARKVYNSAQQSKVKNSGRQRFDCTAWIWVSDSPNEEKLLRDIAEQVGLEKKKIEHNVEYNLHHFLSTRRYVIVIDDIWETTTWDALRNGLPTNSENGSRIILTSRKTNVGEYVGTPKSVRKLEPLDENTSRILFYKLIVDWETQDSPQLQNIAEQILNICGGVPLAIVVAAGLLKSKVRSEPVWRGVLEKICEGKDRSAEIFALSYKDLPLYLKPCFLYFGIFPKDREVDAFDLINLWAVEGFISGSSVREVEEVGDDYLNQLIERNLIQVVQSRYNERVRSVRIHDILHNLCIRVGKEINFFTIHTNGSNCNTELKVRRVTIHGSDIDHCPALYTKTQTSSLRAVFSFVRRYPWNSEASKNFLRDPKFLRVLRVEEDNDIPRSLLAEICNLRQLTYLKLGSPKITVELPYAISNLESLQTLDVEELLIVYLPNVIWSMKQLRHILLPFRCHPLPHSRVNLDHVFHPVKFSLPNLQTFHGLPGELFKVDWLHKLTNLRTLRVNSVNKDIVKVLHDATPVSLKLEELSLSARMDDPLSLPLRETASLNLYGYDNLCELCIWNVKPSEWSHDKLPPNLTKLTLILTHLTMDPTEALKRLQQLKVLNLGDESYLGRNLVFSGESGNFPRLEVLEIGKLPNLEMVVVEGEAMPRLRDLRMIHNCSPETQIPDRVKKVMTTIDEKKGR